MKYLLVGCILFASFSARAEVIEQAVVNGAYLATVAADIPTGFHRAATSPPGAVVYDSPSAPSCALAFGPIRADPQTLTISLFDDYKSSIADLMRQAQVVDIIQPTFAKNPGGTSIYIGGALLNSPNGIHPLYRLSAQGKEGGRVTGSFYCSDSASLDLTGNAAKMSFSSVTISIVRANGQTSQNGSGVGAEAATQELQRQQGTAATSQSLFNKFQSCFGGHYPC